ncbi:MAG: serine hydrolase [Acidobacteriota bacterium]|nr:serine hydrolase [Acidobacteriota bacterium]
MRSWLSGVAVACVLGFAPVFAQSSNSVAMKERMDAVANFYTVDNKFMGTILVVERDRTLLDKGYGMAEVEWNIPNSPNVKFRLGSLTKQFTATLILLLQQDGKLRTGDRLSRYLPKTPQNWEKITLANLLGHTSGIPDFTDDKRFSNWCMSPHSHAEEIAFIRDKPLGFKPGTKFEYSNSNYELLGAVIEKVSGRNYADLLRQRILDPLGMKDTGMDTDELILPKRAQGYSPGKKGLESARSESMTVPWSAGSMYSTTEDLLRWESGLFGGKLLNDASLKAMTTAGKGDYGLGVRVAQRDGMKVVSHGGAIEGFNTYLSYIPERQIAVVVLSNVEGPAPGNMGPQLSDLVLGKPVVLPSERKAVPIAFMDLKRFVGVYNLKPDFSITIAVHENLLSVQYSNTKEQTSTVYQGAADGHPRFYLPEYDVEIEFVPEAAGEVTSLVLHQAGEDDLRGKKRQTR